MALKGILYLILVAVGVVLTLRNPFAGVVTYSIMTFLRPEVFSYGGLYPYRLPLVVYLVLIASTLLNGRLNRETFRNNSPILFFLFLMVLLQYMGSAAAVNRPVGMHYSEVMLKIVVFCYLTAVLVRTETHFNKLLAAYMFGVGFLAVWGFEQHFRGNYRLEMVGGGPTNSSNGIALMFILFLPLFINLISHSRKPVQLVGIAMTGILLSDIVFTQSRAAFVGLIVMAPYIFLKYKSRAVKKCLVLMLALPVFFFAAESTSIRDESYMDRLSNMFEHGMEVDQSASGRKDLWRAAWNMFKDNMVFGVGQQNYKYHVGRYTGGQVEMFDAHNSFMLLLAESGVLAFCFYLLAIAYFFIELWRIEKKYKASDTERYNQAVLLEGSIIGFILCSMAHSYVTVEYTYWILTLPVIMKNIYPGPPAVEGTGRKALGREP